MSKPNLAIDELPDDPDLEDGKDHSIWPTEKQVCTLTPVDAYSMDYADYAVESMSRDDLARLLKLQRFTSRD